MNVYTREWRSLQPVIMDRHSGGGVAFDGTLHVIAGSHNAGGAPETSTHETLAVDDVQTLDFDVDGLLNIEERAVYGTDPVLKETNADNLDGDEEVNQYGTNPLLVDSDEDDLNDGDEINVWQTNPMAVDSDGDGLADRDEISDANDAERGDENDTEDENVSALLLCAFLVGNLARRRLKDVNVPSKNMNT